MANQKVSKLLADLNAKEDEHTELIVANQKVSKLQADLNAKEDEHLAFCEEKNKENEAHLVRSFSSWGLPYIAKNVLSEIVRLVVGDFHRGRAHYFSCVLKCGALFKSSVSVEDLFASYFLVFL